MTERLQLSQRKASAHFKHCLHGGREDLTGQRGEERSSLKQAAAWMEVGRKEGKREDEWVVSQESRMLRICQRLASYIGP